MADAPDRPGLWLRTRMRQQEEKSPVSMLRQLVLDQLDLNLSKDDPILKILATNVEFKQWISIQQQKAFSSFKSSLEESMARSREAVEEQSIAIANEVLSRMAQEIGRGTQEAITQFQMNITASVESVNAAVLSAAEKVKQERVRIEASEKRMKRALLLGLAVWLISFAAIGFFVITAAIRL